MDNLNRRMDSKYQYIGFLPSSVRIKQNGFWGMNDFEGHQILPSNYIEVFTLSSGHGLIAARDAGFYDIYDFSGIKLNTQSFDDLYSFYGLFGMTKVKIGKLWGIMNKYGKMIVPTQYNRIDKFGKGIFLEKSDGQKEFIERKDIIKMVDLESRPILSNAKASVAKKVFKLNTKKTRIIK